MLKIAQTGIVITHDNTISLSIFKFRAVSPLASPTPKTAPTNAWVVDIGIPNFEARSIVVAAPNSAEKPLVGVSAVIL